jgi:NAD(P)-dependent dehydrogenase (short-subunit alcohol dehydrogenase family)
MARRARRPRDFADLAWLQGWTAALRLLVPLGRIGTPDDLGKAAVFLASDDNRCSWTVAWRKFDQVL